MFYCTIHSDLLSAHIFIFILIVKKNFYAIFTRNHRFTYYNIVV